MVARVCVWPPTCRNISVQSSIYIHVNVFRCSLIKIHLAVPMIWSGGCHGLVRRLLSSRWGSFTCSPLYPSAANVLVVHVTTLCSRCCCSASATCFIKLVFHIPQLSNCVKLYISWRNSAQKVCQSKMYCKDQTKNCGVLKTWKEKSARGAATCIKEGLRWTPWKHPLIIYACLHFSSPPSIYVSSRPF